MKVSFQREGAVFTGGNKERAAHVLSLCNEYDTRFNHVHSIAKFTVKCKPFLGDDTTTHTTKLAVTLLQRMCALIAELGTDLFVCQ